MKANRLTPSWTAYKDAGFNIIPLWPMETNSMGERVCTCNSSHCKAAGKHPMNKRWENFTLSPEAIQRQINSRHNAFGVSADGWLIVDVDPRNGGALGLELLEQDLDCYLEDIAGLTVQTGGGGLHYYFKAPEGVHLVTGKKEYPGVDFVHGLHYVVGAGSDHRSGGLYTIKKGSPEAVTDAPQTLVDLLERKPWVPGTGGDGETDPEMVADALMTIPNDDVDYDEWLRIGMALRHWDDDAGYALYHKWSEQSSKYVPDDLDRRWASFGDTGAVNIGTIFQRAIANGWVRPQPPAMGTINEDGSFTAVVVTLEQREMMRKAMDTPRKPKAAEPAPAESVCVPVEPEPEPAPAPAPVMSVPVAPRKTASTEEFKINLPGWAGIIYDYMYKTAMSPQPGAIAAAALQTLAVAAAGMIGYEGLPNNLITMVIAESATGKEHPQNVFCRFMRAIDRVTYPEMRSDKDFLLGIIDSPNRQAAYVVDEAHALFAAMVDKHANVSMKALAAAIMKTATSTSLALVRNWKADLTARALAESDRNQRQADKVAEGKGVWKDRTQAEINMEVARLEALAKLHMDRCKEFESGFFDNIHFALMCSSTPTMFEQFIDSESVNNGMIGRALLFDCGGYVPPLLRHKPPANKQKEAEIIQFLQQLKMASAAGCEEVGITQAASALMDEIHTIYGSNNDVRTDPEIGALNRRVMERIKQVASILSFGMPPLEGRYIITEESLRCARALVELHVDNSKFQLKQQSIDESELAGKQAIQERIMQFLRTSSEEQPIKRSALRQKVLKVKRLNELNQRMAIKYKSGDTDYLGTEIKNLVMMGMIKESGANLWITEKGAAKRVKGL